MPGDKAKNWPIPEFRPAGPLIAAVARETVRRQPETGMVSCCCSCTVLDDSRESNGRSTVNRDITDRARADRLGLIRAELVPRIRPLCQAMPDDLFLELIDAMAEIQLKYEMRESDRSPGAGSTSPG